MKIGGNDDFKFKKTAEGNSINPFQNNVEKTGTSEQPDKVKKASLEEGAASLGSANNHEPKLDKSNFTNENDIQEIDLSEFEDDFE